jgi:predicted HTH transcriptional regulator
MATLSVIEAFLGLSGPAEGRQREGYRVDLKGVDPNGDPNRAGICKAAAAFANSYGGLVVVGVTANAGCRSDHGCEETGELKTRRDGIVVLSADVPIFY